MSSDLYQTLYYSGRRSLPNSLLGRELSLVGIRRGCSVVIIRLLFSDEEVMIIISPISGKFCQHLECCIAE